MDGTQRPSPLDRVLRLFTDVRAGEGRSVLLLALNIFVLLTAYYVLKPIREALILGEAGPEFKAYAAAAMAILLVPLAATYGKLADRYPRRRLINVVTLFFVACIVVFYLLGQAGMSTGLVFFIWMGIFNVMVVAQFWAFANDVYTNEEGERLFPIVQVGGAAGAIVGAATVGQLIEPLGLFIPMLIAGGLLLLSLLITYHVDRRERARTEAMLPLGETTAMSPAATGEFRLDTGEFKNLREAVKEALERLEAGEDLEAEEPADEPEAGPAREPAFTATGAFQLVLRTRYLLFIGLLIVLLNWVNTNGENLLGFIVTDAANQFIGAFYSDFFFGVNVLALLLQLFVVSRVIKHFGVHVAIMILPVIAMGAYGLVAAVPALGYLRWAKTAENSTDYSLQNTVRHTLFLPTTREQKYKAKQVIDSFFWRVGDTLAGVTVLVVTSLLASNVRYFALLNMVLLAAWLFLAYRIGRMYKQLVASGRPPVTRPPRRAG